MGHKRCQAHASSMAPFPARQLFILGESAQASGASDERLHAGTVEKSLADASA